jgi:thymidine kinase
MTNTTLDLIIGPMFAGKSCELIRRIRILKVLQKNYIVVKPSIDNRYEDDMGKSYAIISHNFDKEHCIVLQHMNDIFDKLIANNNINTIFIDEGQFFDDLKEVVIRLVEEYHINVVITGLDGDSNRNKFGQILDLIPYSTSCTKINACCVLCMDGTPAPFSYRKKNINEHVYAEQVLPKQVLAEQVLIGANDMYMSLCRKHYLEGNL